MSRAARTSLWAAALLPAAIALTTPGAAAAQTPPQKVAIDPDPWFGTDKALHFSISAGIAGGGYGITSAFTPKLWPRLAIGGGVAIAVGAGKELLDMAGLGDPSWKDFAWDVIGVAVGLGVAVVIDFASRGPAFATAH